MIAKEVEVMRGISAAFKSRPPGVWLICGAFALPVGRVIWHISLAAYAGALGMVLFYEDAFWILSRTFILIVTVGGGVISLFRLKKTSLVFFLGAIIAEIVLTIFYVFSKESLAILDDRFFVILSLAVLSVQIASSFYIMHLRRIGILK